MREGTEEALGKVGPKWRASAEQAIVNSTYRDSKRFGQKVDKLQIEINEFESGLKGNVINLRERLNELKKDSRVKESPVYQQKTERMFKQLDDLKH